MPGECPQSWQSVGQSAAGAADPPNDLELDLSETHSPSDAGQCAL